MPANVVGVVVIEFVAHAFVSVTVNCTFKFPAVAEDYESTKLYLKFKEVP
jgi:hypothetical protein